jgi:hypothetical protein
MSMLSTSSIVTFVAFAFIGMALAMVFYKNK